MDIICRRCGEPWDADELHEAEVPYAVAARLFRQQGCGAVFGGRCEPVDDERTAMAGVAADLCGDDMDGYASDCDLI